MRWMICVALLLACQRVQAQTTDEWLNQKKTGLRYLAEQIAALKVYAGYLDKGYGIVRDGLAVIGDHKRGEFSLHKDYFAGLQKAKPDIQKSWKAAAIILSAHRIMKLHMQNAKVVRQLKGLDQQAAQEIPKGWNGVLNALANTISELQMVIQDDAVSISDEGRLGWINILYDQMQTHEQFAVVLAFSTKALVENKKLEVAANNTLKSLYRK